MIGGTGGGAKGSDLFAEELHHAVRVQQRLALLVKKGFVGRTAAFGQEEELVYVAVGGMDVDLGGHVVAGIDLAVHIQGGQLGIPEVGLRIGFANAFGERRLVATGGPNASALFGDDDGGAGVLAHGQHAGRGDDGVLQKIEGDEPVVVGSFRIVEDLSQLRQMPGPH